MNNAEQNFRESLRSFNASGGGRAAAPPGGGFSFSSAFGGSAGARPVATATDPAGESLLGGFRTRTQSAWTNLGWGGGPQEMELFGLTRWQRLVGCVVCLGLAVFCFFIAFFLGLPVLPLSPHKFASLFTLGSILAVSALALLQGPRSFFSHIITKERLPFTAVYFVSMALTLYFSIGRHSYVLTIISSVAQLIALLWYFGSYLPGGAAGLGFITRYFARNSVGLPV
ncbi:Got1/Sft2-like family-domain-containing protein [Fimicolochytrium jonesii]|uniref:Got1/Sft2-like family-domain-containing protein n=1 Tax=Fimicolochytrium jonesii TaxID=1396493 RepID=UPI0022FED487|nr:Got1/Sft2-like family-domain-containing protein [Fimicolochytrium jonesii]KAI8815608.1 Got1/Sft2-like family-domain-containing protein [Fimicolochytrium jonesii]